MAIRVSSPVLVGRQSELAELRAAVEAADRGESGPVVVAGEAGVGKSRLLSELAAWADSTGHRVLIGGCVALSAEVAPFAPLLEALRQHSGGKHALGDGMGGSSATDMVAVGVSPDGSQVRTLELLFSSLVEASAAAPVVLIIEDVQWIDASTADALAFLARNIHAERLQLIVTYRTDEAARLSQRPFLIAELARHPGYRLIELRRLDRADTAGMLSAILNRPAQTALVNDVYARSQGNAFLAEELLAASGGGGEMPRTLRDALASRISALEPGTRELVRVASAAGREYPEALLARLSGLDSSAFPSALRSAVEHNILVREVRDEHDRLRFRHALMQELLYSELLVSERKRLHAAAAEFIEEQTDGRSDAVLASELAYHWQAADRPERALAAAVSAGMAAEAAHAPQEAATQFERALVLLERLDRFPAGLPLDHIGLLEHAAANLLSQPDRAVGHIRAALDLVDEETNPVRAGLLQAALGRYLWFAGDGAAAREACRTAVRLLEDRGTPAQRARALAGLAQILMILAEFGEAGRVGRQAIALAEAAGEPLLESHALCTLGVVVSYVEDPDAGMEMLQRALELAMPLNSDDDIGRAVANIIDVGVITAHFADAAASAIAALEREPPLSGVWAALTAMDAAWALYSAGEWDRAQSLLQQARRYPAAGAGEIEWLLRQAQLQVGRGDFEDADRSLEVLNRALESAADTQWIAPASTVQAERAVWGGDSDNACRVIDEALDRTYPSAGANVSRIGPMLAMGVRAAADASQQPVPSPSASSYGERFLAQMRSIHEEVAMRWPQHLVLADPWLALCEAEASRVGGHGDPQLWGTAARLFEELGMPYVTGYALLRQSVALMKVRRNSAAVRDLLRSADAIARQLSARPLAAAIEEVAARANVELGASRSGGRSGRPAGLSEREVEVLALVAAGMTNREIGERLFITPKTASHHVSSVIGKLDVRSRSEAAAVAARMGIGADRGHATAAGVEGSE